MISYDICKRHEFLIQKGPLSAKQDEQRQTYFGETSEHSEWRETTKHWRKKRKNKSPTINWNKISYELYQNQEYSDTTALKFWGEIFRTQNSIPEQTLLQRWRQNKDIFRCTRTQKVYQSPFLKELLEDVFQQTNGHRRA